MCLRSSQDLSVMKLDADYGGSYRIFEGGERCGGTNISLSVKNLRARKISAINFSDSQILIAQAGHPTFMDAEGMMFSGDWPGHLQRTMEAIIANSRS